jgi:hydrogenase nickel incorporation protein HypA/HybF
MHELSLAGGILRIVEDAATREHFTRISRLRLEVGALAGVDVRSLRFALEAIAPGTWLEGAELLIDEPAGQAFCFGCGANSEVHARGAACPACGSYRLQPTGGLELRVVELTVRDAVSREEA